MNKDEALKLSCEVSSLCHKNDDDDVWVSVKYEHHPRLTMIRMEISVKVDKDE